MGWLKDAFACLLVCLSLNTIGARMAAICATDGTNGSAQQAQWLKAKLTAGEKQDGHTNGSNVNNSVRSSPHIVDVRRAGALPDLVNSIRTGLRQPEGSKELPSLLLWNEEGLKYFEDITYIPEYYLANAEIGLLKQHSHAIAKRIESGSILLDLGSGNLRKVGILLKALEAAGKVVDYYALDLTSDELERTLKQLGSANLKHVTCHGLLGTFEDGQAWLSRPENVQRPRCVLSMGSTIGSMTRPEAIQFWKDWTNTLQQGSSSGLVIMGIDACKDEENVYHAYNDCGGANRRFVLNALDHANKLLGQRKFNVADWTSRGVWDAGNGRHDQYLVSTKDVRFEEDVVVPAGEKVFVVSSYKYDDLDKAELWSSSGLDEAQKYMTKDGTYGMWPVLTRPQRCKCCHPLTSI